LGFYRQELIGLLVHRDTQDRLQILLAPPWGLWRHESDLLDAISLPDR
jgi:hypothetical protein